MLFHRQLRHSEFLRKLAVRDARPSECDHDLCLAMSESLRSEHIRIDVQILLSSQKKHSGPRTAECSRDILEVRFAGLLDDGTTADADVVCELQNSFWCRGIPAVLVLVVDV